MVRRQAGGCEESVTHKYDAPRRRYNRHKTDNGISHPAFREITWRRGRAGPFSACDDEGFTKLFDVAANAEEAWKTTKNKGIVSLQRNKTKYQQRKPFGTDVRTKYGDRAGMGGSKQV